MLQDVIKEKKEPPGKRLHAHGAQRTKLDIAIPTLLPKTQENKAIYENGLSHLLHRLRLKVHSDYETCFDLWDQFSPKRTVFHTWSYRAAWGESYKLTPFFYTIYEGNKPLAVLPLSYNDELKKFVWFGSDEEWMEDNQFFAEDDKIINLLLKVCPQPALLSGIEHIPFDKLYTDPFVKDYDKYVKDLSPFKTVDDYFVTLSKKHRYNLKKDIEFIDSYNPRIEVRETKDIQELVELAKISINRFTAKEEESNFTDVLRMNAFKQTMLDSGEYGIRFLKVYIQNRLVASDMIMTYKDTYSIPRGGADSNRFPGIGNYMVYLNIKDALEHGFKMVDCLQTDDGGYKHRLLDAKPMWRLETA